MCTLIQECGKFNACLLEVGQEQWHLHQGPDVVPFEREKCQGVINSIRLKPEVMLIVTKGKIRETGELQEYFDRMGIPFSNSGTEQTRVTNNKFECSNVLRAAGLPVVRSLLLLQNKVPPAAELADRVGKGVGFPCFVKPNRHGGSLGITKVQSSEGLLSALEAAFQFGKEAVVESAVLQGVEVSCTVHDITTDDLLEAFPVTEITPSGEFFHSSHSEPGTQIITPAKTLRGEVAVEVVKVAKVAYRALKLAGLASFDIIVQDDLPVILEVNSVPALGPGSLIERQVKAGLSIQWQRSLPKFYTHLADHAIKTYPLIREKAQKGNQKP